MRKNDIKSYLLVDKLLKEKRNLVMTSLLGSKLDFTRIRTITT